ncbi:unnamed protein product [Mytilus coruscus]|uniref:B box-type domain-containing protein n=1 Tax=Mytilus coruscus TaxID=42192 RepID=A0A6J8CIR7_MYTCO|nr:unnamed protein product [Mytilus coruscus]
MTSNISVCGVCDHRHVTKPSVVWCSECDEGLCKDCQEHHSSSRNHETIPITEYMKLPVIFLQKAQFCNKHNEKYELFCRTHDCPCCKKCVEDHDECEDLTDIRNVILNVKSSTAFQEMEHTLLETAENIKRIRINREENLTSLAEKRKIVELDIQQFKNKIIEHLDKLQDEILKEFKEVEKRESTKIRQLLNFLTQKEKEISEYQGHFQNTKQYASEYQSFFALKQIENYIANEDDFIQSIVKEKHAHQIDLTCSINTSLQQFNANMKKFGDVLVTLSPCNIAIINRKHQQAQIIIDPLSSFDRIFLTSKQTIRTSLTNIRGGTFLPGDRMAFSCYQRKEVVVFEPKGSEEFKLTNIGRTFDVVYIGDDSLAVTSGGNTSSRQIRIVDINHRRVKKIFEIDSPNTGVAFKDGKLVYCARKNGLKMINLSDESITSITATEMSNLAGVAILGDRLFYTNKDDDSVTCCDFDGNTVWTYSDRWSFRYPLGISVDNDENVYVVGCHSNNLVIISKNCTTLRILLWKEDGLNEPSVVEYDRTKNKLLVANTLGKAFVYDVFRY